MTQITATFNQTCATCPFFTAHNDGTNKGWCSSFDRFARDSHAATETCNQAIAAIPTPAAVVEEVQPEVLEVATLVTKPAATPVKKEELQVYLSPKTNQYIVRNSAKRTRYTVQVFGSGTNALICCSCPHHQQRSKKPGFVDKHIDAVEQALFSKATLTREPILLEPARGIVGKPSYRAFIGNVDLGLVTGQVHADLLADYWFASSKLTHRQNEKVMASYAA